MVQFEIHYFMITSITPITTDFHYYITKLLTSTTITTITFLPNLEMHLLVQATFGISDC